MFIDVHAAVLDWQKNTTQDCREGLKNIGYAVRDFKASLGKCKKILGYARSFLFDSYLYLH
jgi:hypothetical protein